MNSQIKKDDIKYKENTGPIVILVAPQMGENIGTTARAMLNCGLMDLRLVTPRDGWPDAKAYGTCSGADTVLDNLKIFDTTAEAIRDINMVFATTARHRYMNKDVHTPLEAAQIIKNQTSEGFKTGFLFGCERSGLPNEDITLCDAIVSAPLNPEFSSLNLAQAVLLVVYQWYQLSAEKDNTRLVEQPVLATKEALTNLFDHLETELDKGGFFKTEGIKPLMVQNVRNMLHKASLTDQEVRTLHGMIVALTGRSRKNENK